MKFSVEKFWSRVDKSGECWMWMGPKVGRGYGKCGYKGRTQRAHRVSYELAYGPFPQELCVCHKCDNPTCVRPDHLFLGTVDDNNKDMARKGRSASGERNNHVIHPERYPVGDQHYSRVYPEKLSRGEKHGNAKLTSEQVRTIRERYAGGDHRITAMMEEYGIGRGGFWGVVNRRTWKHVP